MGLWKVAQWKQGTLGYQLKHVFSFQDGLDRKGSASDGSRPRCL